MRKIIWVVLLSVSICPLTLAQKDKQRQPSGLNVFIAPYTISGQVTNAQDGMPLAGVTMTQGWLGNYPTSITTDANGHYSFGASSYSEFDITPAKSGFSFTPVRAVVYRPQSDRTINFTALPPPPPGTPVSAGDVLISEFRLDGPNGAQSDEFIELYNNTNHPITVGTTDGSPGWAVGLAYTCIICGYDPPEDNDHILTYVIVPNGTTIPARGHWLWANTLTDYDGIYKGYSLKNYGGTDKAVGDASDGFFVGIDSSDDFFDGIALFTSANQSNWSLTTRLDAVGSDFNNVSRLSLFVEGTGISCHGDYGASDQYSWLRQMTTGTPQDTNNNSNDFVIVSPAGVFAGHGGVSTIVGAPGPENLSSPIQHNADVKTALIDPQQLSTAPPNRERDTTPNVCGNTSTCAQGTLTLRRKFTNKTGAPISTLRFRIVDITTLHTPNPGGAQAELRAFNSGDVTVSVTGGGSVTVKGTSVEQPPTQSMGGGLNSSLVVALSGGALAPNASVSVQFVLGVQQNGRYRFLVNVEAVTGAGNSPQKLAGARLSK
ncbi:MAG: hypothetical protein ACJ74W_12780 [Pyrinomonadaceae bacterium]